VANNWIGNSQPVQAKTEIRIKAQNADSDLNSLLQARNVAKPVLKNEVGLGNYWDSLSQLNDKSQSGCQLYIDKSICGAGKECKYNIFRLEAYWSNNSNPFSYDDTVIINCGDIFFTNKYFYNKYQNIYWDEGAQVYKQPNIELAISFVNSLVESEYVVSYLNMNKDLGDCWFYIAVPYVFSHIYHDNSVVTWINGQLYTNGLCVHIAGCSGACAGSKASTADTSLPKSNIYISDDDLPKLSTNCNPFGCYGGIGACISNCPFGAIKHKQTSNNTLPVNESIAISSSALFVNKPFEEA